LQTLVQTMRLLRLVVAYSSKVAVVVAYNIKWYLVLVTSFIDS